MMLRHLVLHQMEWLNVRVGNTNSSLDVREGYLWAFFAVLFMSHLTNLSIRCNPGLVHGDGLLPSHVILVRDIAVSPMRVPSLIA